MRRPELVLLPGMDGTGRLFEPLLAALAPTLPCRVVAYPAEPLSLEELIARARAAIPDGPHVLVAESFSGPIAVRLASEHPPGLRGLVLVSTFLRAPVPARGVARALAGLLPPLVPPGVAARVLLGRRGTPELRVALHDSMRQLDGRAWRARVIALLDADAREHARDVRVPVLVLRGRGDCLVGASATRELLDGLPKANVVELDGPHLLLQALPVQCAALLAEFIEDAGPAERSDSSFTLES